MFKETGNSYYKYLMDIDTHVLRLKPAELVKNGKKYKVDHGEVEVRIRAKLLADANDQWKNSPILKHFQTIFWKRINRKVFDDYKRELYQQAYKLQESIKQYLQLTTYLPEEEGQQFWPQKQEFG